MSEQLTIPEARPDPSRPMDGQYHGEWHGQETERETARRIAPRTGSQRQKVLDFLRSRGEHGATDNEMHFIGRIGARPHVPGSRRGELISDGWPIVDSGKRRKTDCDNGAIVWVLREDPVTDEPYIPPYVLAAMEKAGVSVELVEELVAQVEVTSTCPKCNEEVEDPGGLGVLHHPVCGYCAHPSLDKGYCTLCGVLIKVEQTVLAIPGPDRESGYGV